MENSSNMAVSDDNSVMVETQRQFSVKVEVEPCNDTNLDEAEPNYSDCVANPIKIIPPKPKDLHIKQYVINPDDIIKEMEKISRTTTNLADQLLSIELRNSLGRGVLNIIESTSQDKIIQNAICKWRTWKRVDKVIREPPLCYKCYICKKGWWHLTPFREHLNQHEEKNLKVELEISFHECSFAACLDKLPNYEAIPIKGKCWKCNKTFTEHLSCKHFKYNSYVCKPCNARHYTCVLLRIHEGTCEMYRKALSNCDMQVSFKLDQDKDLGITIKTPKNLKCHICNLICLSNYQLSEHMMLRHSVRSDLPEASIPLRDCPVCKDKVVKQNLHPCKLQSNHASCNYCCRKFQNKFMAALHMKMSQNDVQCRVCSTYLPKQCMEMVHLVEHSENYRLAYKCLLCPNITYSLSESSIRKHRVILHTKHDANQSFYELILIPKGCIENSLSDIEVELQDSKKELLEVHSDCENDKIEKDSYVLEVDDETGLVAINSTNELNDTICSEKKIIEEKSSLKNKVAESTLTRMTFTGNNADKSNINDSLMNKKQTNYKISEMGKEDIQYDSDSDINKKQPRFETDVYNKVEIVKNGVQYNEDNCFTLEVKNIKKELNEDEENSKLFEIEDEILKVFQASKILNIKPEIDNLSITEEIHIKNEPIEEEDYEDDIIVLRMDDSNNEADLNSVSSKSHRENYLDALNVACKNLDSKEQNSLHNAKEGSDIFDITDEDDSFHLISHDPIMINCSTKVFRNSYKRRRLYSCNKCQFEGFHREFKEHTQKSPDCYLNKTSHGNFKCTKCNTTFVSLAKYAAHFKEHNIQANACPQCLVINNPYKQVNHINLHVKYMFVKVQTIQSAKTYALNYRCRKCNIIVEKSNLFSHWEDHLEIKDIDIQKFENLPLPSVNHELQKLDDELQQQVTELLQISNGEWAQRKCFKQCIVCKHNFARIADMKRHLIEHLLANAYAKYIQNGGLACQICNELFQKTEQYKHHMRDHANLPIYKCELCNKSFGDSSNFSKHKKVHNLAVVICDICKQKFHSKVSLAIHIQMHLTTAPIECALCQKNFLSNSKYKKHVKNAHKGNRPRTTCKLCSINFISFKMKWDHMWEVHSIRKYKADCPICHLSFRKFIDVKKHCKEEHNTHTKLQKFEMSDV